MSSRVNEALHQLSSPLRRAEYILTKEGYAGEETDKLEDMELLMEIMEAREGLASADSPDEVAQIRQENDGAHTLMCCPLFAQRHYSENRRSIERNSNSSGEEGLGNIAQSGG